MSDPQDYDIHDGLLSRIKRHEGAVRDGDRHVVYDDATGKPITKGTQVQGNPTIGYGRLVTGGNGISEAEAMELLRADVASVRYQLDRQLPWWRSQLDMVRRQALLEMAFNMGVGGLLTFKKMLAELKAGNYGRAAEEALDSRWAEQVGYRAKNIAARIQQGNHHA
jgi:lysozyme